MTSSDVSAAIEETLRRVRDQAETEDTRRVVEACGVVLDWWGEVGALAKEPEPDDGYCPSCGWKMHCPNCGRASRPELRPTEKAWSCPHCGQTDDGYRVLSNGCRVCSVCARSSS
jgi:hypothetical protein